MDIMARISAERPLIQTTKKRGLLQISVRGIIQGVGFRPFVYQLAQEHNLKGWVCNTSGDVKIEIEGNGQSAIYDNHADSKTLVDFR